MKVRVCNAPVRGIISSVLQPAAVVLSLVLATAASAAQDPGFPRDLPTADQVLAHFGGGSDRVQSLRRQCAALDLLERNFLRRVGNFDRTAHEHPATQQAIRDYAAGFPRASCANSSSDGTPVPEEVPHRNPRVARTACKELRSGSLAVGDRAARLRG